MDGRTDVVLKKASQIVRSTVAGYGLKDKKHTWNIKREYKTKTFVVPSFHCFSSLFFSCEMLFCIENSFSFLFSFVVVYWKKYYDFPIVLKSHLPPPTLENLKISTFATNKSMISKDLSHSLRMKSGMNGWNMFNVGDFFTAVAIIVVVVLVCW